MSAENRIVPLQRTYSAKGFSVATEFGEFLMAGTLEGFIDFAVPGAGTYPISPAKARLIAAALAQAADDVRENCLYERDVLLRDDRQ